MGRAGGATPAVRALDRADVRYTLRGYDHDPRAESFGLEAAQALDVDPDRVLKTLLAVLAPGGGRPGHLVVGVVPVSGQLDLKALARALGGSRASMAPVAEAERATGYVAGGISPLGQRRRLPTVVDDSALAFDTVLVSAGRRGLDVELAPGDLVRLTEAVTAPVARRLR